MATYFSNLPNLKLPVGDNGDMVTVKNLYRGVKFREDLRRYLEYYEPYDIKDGEKPYDVAFKFYGDPTYEWIVLLFNQITDIRNEWPMSELELVEFIRTKYPNPYAAAYYLTKEILHPKNGAVILEGGLEVNQDFTFQMPPFFTGYPFYADITEGDTRAIPVDNNFGPELVKNISNGQQVEVSGELFPSNVEIDTVSRSTDGQYSIILSQAALTTQSNVRFVAKSFQRATLSGSQVLDIVTYNDYERELNESKGKLNILAPEVIPEFINEFEEKIAYKQKTEYVPETTGIGISSSLARFF